MNIVSKFTVEKNLQYKSDPGFRNNINFILTFVSVIIFGAFAIRPSINTITGLIKDIDEYRSINSVLIEKISILNETKSNPEEFKQETELIARALPESPEEGNYVRNINFLAAKNDIQLNEINFSTSKEDGLNTLTFQISIIGEYSRLVKFVSDFNKLLRITSIEDVSITPLSDESSAVIGTISGKAYFVTDND